MKGMFLDDSMSNLTSASNEASLSSSSNKNEVSTIMYPPPQHQSLASVPFNNSNTQIQTNSNKKKRNLPGNPDPEAEVIAMSPKSLMATNRFVCEICNKGFQRDQNLQLHRRGHNLPWKLKQRSKLEVVRKKVYVCPEPSCVHHEPARALGDLTGIKKHFSRKHGEKKWKCDKCSKRYAVQSDWKAHSKICGTREYRCECGTLFSRRDSFITHRAFCGALAGENNNNNARSLSSSSSSLLLSSSNHLPLHLPLKTEPPQLHLLQQQQQNHHLPPSWFFHQQQQQQNPNANANENNNFHHHNHHLQSSSSPHMSATALLQKAAHMGVAMSDHNKPATTTVSTNPAIVMSLHQQQQQHQSILSGPHPHDHMCAPTSLLTHHHQHHINHHNSGLGILSSSDHDHHEHQAMMMHGGGGGGGGGFGNMNNNNNSGGFDQTGGTTTGGMHNMHADHQSQILHNTTSMAACGGNDELTRDFLGITRFPINPTISSTHVDDHHHFLRMAALDQLSTYHDHQQQNQQEEINDHNQNQNDQLPNWQG